MIATMDEKRIELEYELKPLRSESDSNLNWTTDEVEATKTNFGKVDVKTGLSYGHIDSDAKGYTTNKYNGESEGGKDLESLTESNEEPERETWTRGLDFILSLLGYAVGLGNLWRFPYLCMRNGGGAFLIPFLICLLTCGLPLFFLEVSLGQFLGKSSLHAWVVCPLFKGLGLGMMIVNVMFSLYYNMIIAWTLYYIGNSFAATLPWNKCDGWWNTDNCFIQGQNSENANASHSSNISLFHASLQSNDTIYSVTGSVSQPNGTLLTKMSSEEEFWQYNVLQISSGLGDFGTLPWHLIICFLGAWIIVFLCIMKGVRSIGKVIYVTALLPYVLLTILLVKGLTLDGAVDGIVYYLKPDLKKMMSVQVWVEAALQVFFSLGPGWGPLISMASYNRFHNNCLKDSLIICFIGEGTSIFSGFVVFTILGFISHELNLPIQDVVNSGPGLGFVAYPKALARLPVPQFWAVLFFIMLLTVGLDSQFSSVENFVACIIDMFPKLRKRRLLVSLFACMVGFVIGIPLCFQGGMYIFQLVDWYVAIIAVPVFGLMECVIFGWIYGTEKFCRDIELMIGRKVPLFMRISWCFMTPLALALCLVSSLMTYVPPSIGSYNYPVSGQILGWIIAFLPLVPVLVVAVYQLCQNRDKLSFSKRFWQSLKPSEGWKPHCQTLQKTYNANQYSYNNSTVLQRIKINLIGETN